MPFLKFANADLLEAKIAHRGDTLLRTAHRATFSYTPREGYLYVRSRAISSRTNDNFDTWPAEELREAWGTFIGKPVFVNHNNSDIKRRRGVIIDAALHEDISPDGTPDTWVEVLMEIDALQFPRLAAAILAHDIERTSMGADVGESECSFCGNVATTPSDYCVHIQRHKGQRIIRRAQNGKAEEVLVHEICIAEGEIVTTLRGPVPIEDVVVGDSALTRSGWRTVIDARQTGVRPTVQITLTDGGTLRCTEDHLIATAAGWTPASALLSVDVHADAAMPVRSLAGVHVDVLGSEGVPSLAMGLRGMPVVQPMQPGFDHPEVVGVDAVVAAADSVIDFKTSDVVPKKSHHSTMDQSFVVRLAVDAAVPVGGCRALPDQAVAVLDRPPQETFQFVQVLCVNHAGIVPVYDLTVEDEHEFVVNGIVVHNCRKISFFENSVLVEPPADPTALTLGVDSRGLEGMPDFEKLVPGGSAPNAHHSSTRDAEHRSNLVQGPADGGAFFLGVDDTGVRSLGMAKAASTGTIQYGQTVTASAIASSFSEEDGFWIEGEGRYGFAGWISPDGMVTVLREHRDADGGYRSVLSSGSIRISCGGGRVDDLGQAQFGFGVEVRVTTPQIAAMKTVVAKIGDDSVSVYCDVVRGGFEHMWSARGTGVSGIESLAAQANAKLAEIKADPNAKGRIDEEEVSLRSPRTASAASILAFINHAPTEAIMATATKKKASDYSTITWDEREPTEEKPPLITWDEWEMDGSSNYGLGLAYSGDSLEEAIGWAQPTNIEEFKRGFADRGKTANAKIAVDIPQVTLKHDEQDSLRSIPATDLKVGDTIFNPQAFTSYSTHADGTVSFFGTPRELQGTTWKIIETDGSNAKGRRNDGLEQEMKIPPGKTVLVMKSATKTASAIEATGTCARCHERKKLIGAGAICQDCLDAVNRGEPMHEDEDGYTAKLAAKSPGWYVVSTSEPYGYDDEWRDDYREVGFGNPRTTMDGPFATQEDAVKASGGRGSVQRFDGSMWSTSKLAWGETKAPSQVNTLGVSECAVCGSEDSFDGTGRCGTCGYLATPDPFRAPDLDIAQKIDMRDGWVNPNLMAAPSFVPPDVEDPEPGIDDPVQPSKTARKVQETEGALMRPAHLILAEENRQLKAENAALRAQAGLKVRADANNPGQPVPEPAQSAPTQSTDETRAADATTDVTSLGGSVLKETTNPDANTDINSPGAALDNTAPDATTDVTSPVNGGADRPSYDQTVTLIQPDSRGQNNDMQPAFSQDNSWVQSQASIQQAAQQRVLACLRLARLQIEAGITDGREDDITIGSKLAASKKSDEAIRAEITTLAAVTAQRRSASRRPQRTATRAIPSMATAATIQNPLTGAIIASSSISDDEIMFG